MAASFEEKIILKRDNDLDVKQNNETTWYETIR